MVIYVHDSARHRSPQLRSVGGDLPPLAPGTSWVRFGRETLLYNDDDTTYQVPSAPASRGARFPRRQVNATRAQLHVVVQHGRLFQQHHPDVPVLHDRGRFLLVQLDPPHAERLRHAAETCYGIMPLSGDDVVFEERDSGAARAPDPAIKALTERVARERIEAVVTRLTSCGTRYATSAGYEAAARFAQAQLEAMGYTTATQDVAAGSGRSHNVIASPTGAHAAAARVVVVAAHLDSINSAGGATAAAPGADDNASGSAGVLEIARVFKDHHAAGELRFLLFGAEELGLLGSRRYVASLSASERSRIDAVINMDMIGSANSGSRGVLLEGAERSAPVIDGLAEAARTYTDLTVQASRHPFASDHVPFIAQGIPAVLTIASADNSNDRVHSARDTPDGIDYDLLLEIVRMNVAFIAGSISRRG